MQIKQRGQHKTVYSTLKDVMSDSTRRGYLTDVLAVERMLTALLMVGENLEWSLPMEENADHEKRMQVKMEIVATVVDRCTGSDRVSLLQGQAVQRGQSTGRPSLKQSRQGRYSRRVSA